MSRFGLAPAAISSMLRRRTSSSGSPVKTCTCQGCVFIDDGARFATARISSITARGTGFFLKPRTLLRVCTSVSNSIPLPRYFCSYVSFVMAGLDPAIHVFFAANKQDVDARVKPGHDESREVACIKSNSYAASNQNQKRPTEMPAPL